MQPENIIDDLSKRIASLSPARRALLERRLNRPGVEPARTAIPHRPSPGPVALSFAQQRLWFLDQLQPGSSAYHITLTLRIHGALDVAALERSLAEIWRRHDGLRATFANTGEGPVQRIAPAGPFTLPVTDLTGLPDAEREGEARHLVKQEAYRPFDLERGPLFRARLLRMGEATHGLLVVMHHIISDGWSMGVFSREMKALYEAFSSGRPSPLPPLELQYADFARWQREWLQGETLRSQLAYWKQQLGGALPRLELPLDRPRGSIQTFSGARRSLQLSEAATQAMRTLSRCERATLFMTLLAAFKALLCRYDGQEDIVVGSPIAGRTRIETEPLIGFFVNSLVLRTDLSGNPTFRELIGRVREVTLGAYAHQDLPFEKLVEEIHPQRSLSQTPLFQVFFNMLNVSNEKYGLAGLTVEPMLREGAEAKFDLTMYVRDRKQHLHFDLVYNTDLFEAATIDRMLQHFRALLERIAANPDQRIWDLPLQTAEDRPLARHRVSPTNPFLEFGREEIEQSIPARFSQQARNTAARIAVKTENHEWTYAALDRAANHVARAIMAASGRGEERIALLLEHDAPMIAAVLGALKAGKAYVPLDPAHPRERLAYIVEDSGACAIVTNRRNEKRAAEFVGSDRRVINIDDLDIAAGVDGPALTISPDAVAYLLYTSGSTGQPKGVMQSHRNVLQHIRNYTNTLRLSAVDRLSLLASYGFDAAIMDIFGALLNGAALHPFDIRNQGFDGLAKFLSDNDITIYHSTPTVFRHLVDSLCTEETFPRLRLVVMGGEETMQRDVQVFQKHFSPHCIFVNGYGPTECTVALQHFLDGQTAAGSSVPLGCAVDQTEVFLANGAGRETVAYGEIAIRSAHVALGYWRKPELSNLSFLPDPDGVDRRIYRTGDMGRRCHNGLIAFAGRKDFQVKVRGYRIELGEIKAALRQHPSVRETAVVAHERDNHEKQLLAYIVPRTSDSASIDWRRWLQEKLPDYMVPSKFIAMEALPLTSTGKLDRRALPPPQFDRATFGAVFNQPRDPIETDLSKLWSELLRIERVGIHDNFFDVGGHSLLAIQLISRLRQAFGTAMPVRTLFDSPTIAQLAVRIEESRRGKIAATPADEMTWTYLVPIQRSGTKKPLFLVPGGGGGEEEFLVYARLARLVGDDFPFYGLQASGWDGQREPHTRVEQMAADYIEEIRSFQPNGPYHLAGECVGGIVAYEMGRQLLEQGHEVALLLLLDTPRPTTSRYVRHCVVKSLRTMKYSWQECVTERLAIHWKALKHLTPRERPAYFLDKALKSTVAVAYALHLKTAPDPEGKSEVRRHVRRVRAGYPRSLLRYKPKPYPGRVTLITNQERHRRDPTQGWSGLVTGGIDPVPVPGTHWSYIRADAKMTAAHLRMCLEKVASRMG